MAEEEVLNFGGENYIISPVESAPLGMYGNGLHFSVAFVGNEEQNIEGEIEIRLLIYPWNRLIQMYNLKEYINEYGVNIQGNVAIWVKYKKEYVEHISRDPNVEVTNWVIKCDYNGHPTDMTRKEEYLIEQHRIRDREVQNLRAHICILQNELKDEYRAGEGMAKMYNQKMRAFGIRTEKEEEGEDKSEEEKGQT